tara:strand:- start:9423 stop:10328 length:906 start_codon:yes stop_codon:yes gene_type:complete
MKILITGANGLLGSNLCLMYSKNNEIYATDKEEPKIENCSNHKLDVTKEEDIQLIEKLNPELIIHCAAIINLDYCEENKKEARETNVLGSEKIAKVTKKLNAHMIYISSDSIFDGERGNYNEEDEPNPLNYYGETKLESEKIISSILENYTIIRTNIYGWNKQNKVSLAEWMLNKLENKEELHAVKDVFFSPILVNNLGEAILELYNLKYKGIINVAAPNNCSKLDFAKKIAETFNLDKDIITPISIGDLELKAKRPKNMSLNIEKAKCILKTKLLSINEGLTKFKELREEGFVETLKKDI